MKQNILSTLKKIMIMIMLMLPLACGKGKDKEVKLGQAVVRVNGDEITIHQINDELSANKTTQPLNQKEALKLAAKSLVERQLLTQAAKENKLDRNANVISAIERAKSTILAKAYLEQKMAQSPNPSNEEIKQFRKEHPEYFDNRNQYEFINLILDSKMDLQAFAQMEKSITKFDDALAWLNKNNVKYTQQSAKAFSEKLPLPLIKKLNAMALDECVFINTGNQLIISKLVSVIKAPPSEDEITLAIRNFVSIQNRQKIAENELKKLYSQAKIDYVNPEYSPDNNIDGGMNNASKDASKKDGSLLEKQSKQPIEKNVDSTISKGISGL